jgi:phosphorylcholine metabolism protein LicD
MTPEKLQKLYAEAAARSQARLQKEKEEKARLRSIASAEIRSKLREKELEAEREKMEKYQEQMNLLIGDADRYQRRIKLYEDWLQKLNQRFEKKKLWSWRAYANRMMAKALERDIPKLRVELAELQELIKLKRRQRL